MKKVTLGLLALATFALAQGVQYKLSINGKAYGTNAIVVGGQTYVPLTALKSAGVVAALKGNTLSLNLPKSNVPGGANQVTAVEGCLGEWVFNGIWRVRATNPQKIPGDRHGMSYRFEFRNGTNVSGFAPSGTGWGGIQLSLDNGATVGAVNVNDVSDPPYLPGGSHSQTIEFYWEEAARIPQKLVVVFKPDEMNTSASVKFNTPDPSLRIKTTCQK